MGNVKKIMIAVGAVIAMIAVLLLLVPVERQHKLEEKYGKLAVNAKSNKKAAYIMEHIDEYPDIMLKYYNKYCDKDERYVDFIYNYPEHKSDYKPKSFTEEELNSEKPPKLYMSDPRWCYEKVGENYIFTDGCFCVSLTMAYIGLYHSGDVDPKIVADFAEKKDAIGFLGGVSNKNIEAICSDFNLDCKSYFYDIRNDGSELADESVIKNSLDSGRYVIIGTSGEKFGGHAMLITGYTADGYTLNDPASAENSSKIWQFEELSSEICYIWDIGAKNFE
ncbi:MAG: C39 family peptidase [Oscillospiraceae bacterium]